MYTTLTLRIHSNDGVRHVALQPQPLRIGRAPESDVFINDPAISRHQLSVEPFTSPQGVAALFKMNPQSPNQLIKSGRVMTEDLIFPGEICFIGPYRFEVHAESALPQANAGPLPADPGGAIDLSLVREAERVAPRWRQETGGTDAAAAPKKRVLRTLLLPLATLMALGTFAWTLLDPGGSSGTEMEVSRLTASAPDLFAAMPRLECADPDACLHRARDAVQSAQRLREGGGRDLITLYKIAKQLHRANQALGIDADRIPDLPGKFEQARADLNTLFSDIFFRYQQAKRNESESGQLAALKAMRPLCDEDRHEFCMSLELQYKLLRD